MSHPNGWYGKIPSVGDFISRRLPSTFIGVWDDWLQRVITQSRDTLGAEDWLDAYLVCPVWRFLLFPGICGDSRWVGVMMPSVDKVGRYFPLTVAAELPAFPASEREFEQLGDWLDHLEKLALSALDATQTAQGLDAELIALPGPPITVAAPRVALVEHLVATLRRKEPALLTRLPSEGEFVRTLIGAGAEMMQQDIRGASIWWAPGEPSASMPLLGCAGLPDGTRFTAMLRATSPQTA